MLTIMPLLDDATIASTDARSSIDDVNRLRLALLRTARNIRTHSLGEVTQSQVAVLATLDRHGESTIGQIADHEHVQPPSASKIVASLEARGLVERNSDPDDRRCSLIAATPELVMEAGKEVRRCEAGLHFGSRFPVDPARRAVYDYLPVSLMRLLLNADSFLGIAAFDKWVSNANGRQAIFFRDRLRQMGDHRGGIYFFIRKLLDQIFIFKRPADSSHNDQTYACRGKNP